MNTVNKSIGLKDNEIFVYGSNTAGLHGAGAAKDAMDNAGAIWGQTGLVGNSFGISTKDGNFNVLPLPIIEVNVIEFLTVAGQRQDLVFLITQIGCGLARLSETDIVPMFKQNGVGHLKNCWFDPAWMKYGLQVWS